MCRQRFAKGGTYSGSISRYVSSSREALTSVNNIAKALCRSRPRSSPAAPSTGALSRTIFLKAPTVARESAAVAPACRPHGSTVGLLNSRGDAGKCVLPTYARLVDAHRCGAQLTHLDLAGCTGVSAAGIAALGASCASLERLEATQVPIDDAALEAVARGCPRLSHLALAGRRALTPAAWSALSAHAHALSFLSVQLLLCRSCWWFLFGFLLVLLLLLLLLL